MLVPTLVAVIAHLHAEALDLLLPGVETILHARTTVAAKTETATTTTVADLEAQETVTAR